MFKSSFTKEYEKIMKKRHKNVLKSLSKNKKTKFYEFKGIKLKVYPYVFPPHPDSIYFASFINKIKNPGSVLDLGTGSGILALAVSKRAKRVLATDINKNSLKSVKDSAKLNNIKNIETRYSDVFSNIKEKFDIIIFNPPFRYFKPKNILDAAITDHNYKTLARFFEKAEGHLKPKGKIYFIFSDTGDMFYLKSLIEKNRFKPKLIKRIKAPLFGVKIQNHYYIYELKQKHSIK